MDKGDLVPDSVVIGMIKSKLKNNPYAKGFIFDGFPRTTAQAEALDTLLAELNTAISGMLSLQVDDEELTNKLLLKEKIAVELMIKMRASFEIESKNTTTKLFL